MQLQVNAVVFDWGNTLCLNPFYRTVSNNMDVFLKLLNDKNYPIDAEKLMDSWLSANNLKVTHGTRFLQEEKFVRQALKNMGVKTPDIRKIMLEMIGIYRKSVENTIRNDARNQEVKTVLENLRSKGKKMAIFSNGREGNVRTWLEWAGIPEDYFVFILSSEEIDIEKPDLRVFGLIADRIGEPVDKCVYVGDDPINDIEPAVGYGMKTILYALPWDVKGTSKHIDYDHPCSPDIRINSLSELKDIII